MKLFNKISDLKNFYNQFKNQSLNQINDYVVDNYPYIVLSTNKGIAGHVLEALIGNAPNSDPRPDVLSLGVELKVLPLRKLSGALQPKERSKIKSINYNEIIYEEFDTSLLKQKINQILFLMYEQPIGKTYKDWKELIFKGCLLYRLSDENACVVKEDWCKIKDKIKAEQAHNLTESEGQILGACTSGTGKLIVYGNNKQAKQRSYSLKHRYLKIFYAQKFKNKKFESLELEDQVTVENFIVSKLNNELFGKLLKEVVGNFNLDFSLKSKASFSFLINKILKIERKSKILELEQKGITIKTIPVSPMNKCWEAMSFPKFSLVDLIEEKWDENLNSTFFDTVKNGFIFIPIIKSKFSVMKNGKKKYLYNDWKDWKVGKVFYWKPNEKEILTIKREWSIAKQIIEKGVVTRMVKWGDGVRQENNLLKSNNTKIIHIRPHAQNSSDIDIPYFNYSKNKVRICWQSFWFNKDFINNVINKN